jgi:hypothetical protein
LFWAEPSCLPSCSSIISYRHAPQSIRCVTVWYCNTRKSTARLMMARGVQSPLLVQCIPRKGAQAATVSQIRHTLHLNVSILPFFFYDGSMSCCCSMDSSLVNPGPLINSSGWADPAQDDTTR